ncbi:MAG TPA: hypothetical protein VJV79_09535 [Polyangiaceae bacterium]|nr:hypothetical protein [Polyangiaceae bacterium]
MRSQVLIDAIVRQTTVLIARLSTAEGERSPLGHIANEVFAGLVTELEQQGVSKKVVADMFGMALRSYRQKVQRVSESATSRGMTLWSAVQDFLATRGSATRREAFARFSTEDGISVRGILNDLVENGFVVRTGRGEDTRYRLATEAERAEFGASLEGESVESLAAHVWLQVYREGQTSHGRLAELVPVSSASLAEAVALLVKDGRLVARAGGEEQTYAAEQVLIPVGESAGWEAAVIDHHRAVLNALAAKITAGARTSAKNDEVGGTTLTFDLWPGHPREQEARRLLATVRALVLPFWSEVAVQTRPLDAKDDYQVHFYCGQYVVEDEEKSR